MTLSTPKIVGAVIIIGVTLANPLLAVLSGAAVLLILEHDLFN